MDLRKCCDGFGVNWEGCKDFSVIQLINIQPLGRKRKARGGGQEQCHRATVDKMMKEETMENKSSPV